MLTPRKEIQYERYEFKKWEHFDAETIVETPVSLTVNGRVWLTFMCTPVHLEALCVGFLYNEGIIETMDEVEDARICEHGDNVDVWLNHSVEQPASWRRTSGCTGGVTAVDLLAKPNVPASIKSSSSASRSNSFGANRKTPFLSNIKATDPELPMLPPFFEK